MIKTEFRAWDKKYKKIVPVVCLNLGTNIDHVLHDVENEATYCNLTENLILMQYIGLKDIKENKIFDGYIKR